MPKRSRPKLHLPRLTEAHTTRDQHRGYDDRAVSHEASLGKLPILRSVQELRLLLRK